MSLFAHVFAGRAGVNSLQIQIVLSGVCGDGCFILCALIGQWPRCAASPSPRLSLTPGQVRLLKPATRAERDCQKNHIAIILPDIAIVIWVTISGNDNFSFFTSQFLFSLKELLKLSCDRPTPGKSDVYTCIYWRGGKAMVINMSRVVVQTYYSCYYRMIISISHGAMIYEMRICHHDLVNTKIGRMYRPGMGNFDDREGHKKFILTTRGPDCDRALPL